MDTASYIRVLEKVVDLMKQERQSGLIQASKHRPELSDGFYKCSCGHHNDLVSVMIWWPEHVRTLKRGSDG